MYRNLDYFKDIHILAKFVTFIFCIGGIFFIQNIFVLLFFAICFFALFRNWITFVLKLLFFLLSWWFPVSFLLMKILFLLSIFFLFFQTIPLQEIRQFIEYFSYYKKQSRISYMILYICYFFKYYMIYFKEFLLLRKSYGKKISFSFMKYVVVQSFYKTGIQIESMMKTYQYRFYNLSNKRTYVEKNEITTRDLRYIVFVILVFFFVYFWGRG